LSRTITKGIVPIALNRFGRRVGVIDNREGGARMGKDYYSKVGKIPFSNNGVFWDS
jgi:hypothetical protein